MLRFTFSPNLVPPDRLKYRAPSGNLIEAADRATWYRHIEKDYKDNGIPLPNDYQQIAQHWCCLQLPPGFCQHETGEGFPGMDFRLGLGDYLHGMRVLSELALSTDPLVSQEVAEARAAKCAACPANVKVPGCAPCIGISNLIVGVKGANTTKADHVLRTCGICKCSNQAQCWVPAPILAKGVDATQLAHMRQMPDCWKEKEISAL